jgi:hypothetical protein
MGYIQVDIHTFFSIQNCSIDEVIDMWCCLNLDVTRIEKLLLIDFYKTLMKPKMYKILSIENSWPRFGSNFF